VRFLCAVCCRDERLSGDWLEVLASNLPSSLPSKITAGKGACARPALQRPAARCLHHETHPRPSRRAAGSNEVAALQAELNALQDDPIPALTAIWIDKHGSKSVGAAVARGYSTAASTVASAGTTGRSVGIGAGIVIGAHSSVESEFNRPPAGVSTLAVATRGDDGGAAGHARASGASSTGTVDGPVVETFLRLGLDSQQLLDCARQFEAAAHTRPPMVDASVSISAIRLTLNDSQYRDALFLAGLLNAPPSVAPLPLDLASMCSELGLPPPGTFIGKAVDGSAAAAPTGSVAAKAMALERLPSDRLATVLVHYRRLWYVKLAREAVEAGEAPPTFTAPPPTASVTASLSPELPAVAGSSASSGASQPAASKIWGMTPRLAVRLWLIETFARACEEAEEAELDAAVAAAAGAAAPRTPASRSIADARTAQLSLAVLARERVSAAAELDAEFQRLRAAKAAAAGSGVLSSASDHADLVALEREGLDSEEGKRLVMARYDEVADVSGGQQSSSPSSP